MKQVSTALTLICLAALLTASHWVSAEDHSNQYLVKAKIWMDGELFATPSLLVEAGTDAMVSQMVDHEDGLVEEQGMRMHVRVEPTDEFERAIQQAIWLTLSIEEYSEGQWSLLTDAMIGVPPGETGTVAVADEGIEQPNAENASLFVELEVDSLDAAG